MDAVVLGGVIPGTMEVLRQRGAASQLPALGLENDARASSLAPVDEAVVLKKMRQIYVLLLALPKVLLQPLLPR